jgi:hypothetical protein
MKKTSKVTTTSKGNITTTVRFKQYNKKTTICNLEIDRDGILIELTGKAYCNPDDTFDEKIGRKVALEKAASQYIKNILCALKSFIKLCENDISSITNLGEKFEDYESKNKLMSSERKNGTR